MAVRITYDFDTWDAATISSASEANSDLADDNVVHDFVSLPWRTSADTGQWIKFDLGGATQITCIGLFKFNLTSAATVTLEANATDAWGAPTYSQVLTIPTDSDGNVLERIVLFLDQTFRWWRITFEDAANPDGYIQIGRIAAGAYYEPTRTIMDRFQIPTFDPSEGDRIPGKQSFFRSRERFRRVTVGFMAINQTQTDKMNAIFEKIGNSRPCILALDPTNRPSKDSMYCYLETPLALAHRLTSSYDLAGMVFEEKTE